MATKCIQWKHEQSIGRFIQIIHQCHAATGYVLRYLKSKTVLSSTNQMT